MHLDQLSGARVMTRRDFIISLGYSAISTPIAALAQEAGRVGRIGFLRVGPPPAAFINGCVAWSTLTKDDFRELLDRPLQLV